MKTRLYAAPAVKGLKCFVYRAHYQIGNSSRVLLYTHLQWKPGNEHYKDGVMADVLKTDTSCIYGIQSTNVSGG